MYTVKALLGRVVNVAPKEGHVDYYDVTFKPVCVLPTRTSVPEWLKDQSLKVERQVPDILEVGHPGDSLVLSLAESYPWLNPLDMSPCGVVHELPDKLQLSLRWWKEGDPPEYTVKANGWEVTGKFVKVDDRLTAEVDLKQMITDHHMPVTISVEVEKLHEQCVVMPNREPFWQHIKRSDGEWVKLRGRWIEVDIDPSSYAGGLYQVTELLRQQQHLVRQDDAVQSSFELGGYIDGLSQGWGRLGGLDTAAAKSISGDIGVEGPYVLMEGMANDGLGLRSSLSCQLPDWAPVVVWNRKYTRQPVDKPAEGVQVPISSIDSLGAYGQMMCMADGSAPIESRVYAVEGGRLVTIRLAKEHENYWGRGKRIDGGWIMAYHPNRRQATMVLVDPSLDAAQMASTFRGVFTVGWQFTPQLMAPGSGLCHSAAMAFGEQYGVGNGGAWIACRSVGDDGKLHIGIVARLSNTDHNYASVTCCGLTQETLLRCVPLPGIGDVQIALARFTAPLDSAFDVQIDGVARMEVTQ